MAIYYIMTLISAVCIAATFVLSKVYQVRFGSSATASLTFTFCCNLAMALIWLVFYGSQLNVTLFSLLAATLYQTLCVVYVLIGFKIIQMGRLSVYTLFLMLGGMFLPSVFGVIFLQEQVTVGKALGMAMLIGALVLQGLDRGMGKKQGKGGASLIVLCILVFVLNGCVSIVSKVHQVQTVFEASDTVTFSFLSAAAGTVVSAVLLLCVCLTKRQKPSLPTDKKGWLTVICVVLVYAGISCVSSYFLLTGASHLPASALFPMITGGSLVLSALAGWVFFKEKLSVKGMVAVGLAFLATILFMF